MENQNQSIGAVIDGVQRVSRVDVMLLFKLTNNKCQRLFERSSLPYIERYDRRFYVYLDAVAYFTNALKKSK